MKKTIDDIKKAFPKTYTLLREDYVKGLKAMPELKGITLEESDMDELLKMALEQAPRHLLYPYFDKKKVFISLFCITGDRFCYNILYQGSFVTEGNNFTTRELAEADAFWNAFEITENQ